jgi:antirestriction protein ArdC
MSTHPLESMMQDIIARIERGVPPWRQAWANGAEPTSPLRSDGQPFTGSNAWLLSFAGAVRGYTSPYWFTFRQALAIGAPVMKGARSSIAILYKTRLVEDGGASGDDYVRGGEAEARVLRYLKSYAVFSAHQLTDCPERYLQAPTVDPAARLAARNAILDAIPAVVEFGGNRACYVPSRDVICLPPPERFDTIDDYQATLAHEAAHWSGAPHRLNRTFGERFGDEAYAFEELVAEISACALGLRIGLRPQLLDGHAAYLAHWAKILTDRPSALLEASGHAQRAVDHLLAYSQPAALAETLAA